MTVSWNLLDGPDQNAYRLHQVQQSNADIMERTTPRTNLTFMQLCPLIGQELKDAGVELPGEKDSDLEIWDYWKASQKGRAKLQSCSEVCKRHLLHLTPNKQYVKACDEVGYGPELHEDLRIVVTNNNKVVSCLSPEQGGPRGGHRDMP